MGSRLELPMEFPNHRRQVNDSHWVSSYCCATHRWAAPAWGTVKLASLDLVGLSMTSWFSLDKLSVCTQSLECFTSTQFNGCVFLQHMWVKQLNSDRSSASHICGLMIDAMIFLLGEFKPGISHCCIFLLGIVLTTCQWFRCHWKIL